MSRPQTSRERILDAFETILIADGERAATLEAVAARAGVSKGGLLYHFGSKDALITGLVDRLAFRVAEDVENIRTATEGPISYLLRTSVASQSPLEHTIVACTSLAHGSHESVRAALREMQDAWLGVVRESVVDPTLARVIMLVSDGVYFNSVLREDAATMPSEELDELVRYLVALAERAPYDGTIPHT